MRNCYIIRYHEIALKGGNRFFFERKLVNNIKECLKKNKISYESVEKPRGRIIINTNKNCDFVKNVFGISSFSKGIKLDANIDEIKKTALEMYTKGSFKISAQRSDKKFPITSQQINEQVGEYIVKETKAKVNLNKPETDIGIEIFDNKAYIFTERKKGLGGLPVGTAGKVAVLLESEKSILSAYLMLKRGCSITFVKKKNINTETLEKYSYGYKIRITNKIPTDVKALIVNDNLEKIRGYKTKLVVLRPLTRFTEEEIKKILKGI